MEHHELSEETRITIKLDGSAILTKKLPFKVGDNTQYWQFDLPLTKEEWAQLKSQLKEIDQ